MKPVVIVENVSKKFSRRADIHRHYGIKALVYELIGRSQSTELRPDEFLSVDNVSFNLYPGDTFALIGRNGCGKTTTLQMLNGTLKPDAGRVIIDGRVQALIALGAGFNPRLSGLENIYSAAAVLGLSSKETRAIIDEVVDFAELEEFIDSPVQTYSSGMYARLGFAVAVHLKPEIMLIDEILGVGDQAFQNKCFTKMQQLRNLGVTIILVSHHRSRVVQLCERALWLHKGKPLKAGPVLDVMNAYTKFLEEEEARKVQLQSSPVSAKKTSNEVLYNFIYDQFDQIDNLTVILRVGCAEVAMFRIHDEVVIDFSFDLKKTVQDLNATLIFYNTEGLLLNATSTINGQKIKHIHEGRVSCRVTIKDFNLTPGSYALILAVQEGPAYLYRNIVKEFVVTSRDNMTWGYLEFNYTYEVL